MPQYYKILDNGQGSAKSNQRKASKAAKQPRNKKGPTSAIDASYVGRVTQKAEGRANKAAYQKFGRKGGANLYATERVVTDENMRRAQDLAIERTRRGEDARKLNRARKDKESRMITANARARNKQRRTTKKY